MKSRNVLGVVILSLALSLCWGYQVGLANGKKAFSPVKVGVISLRDVLDKSIKKQQFEQDYNADKDKVMAELQGLEKEIVSLQKDMETRAKNSDDYIKFLRKSVEKQAVLKAKKELYEDEFSYKQKAWMDQMYKQILIAAEQVAKENELDMIIAKRDFETFSEMNNLLYSSQTLDVSSEVLAILDK
jgi:Skp family chaperone for outer membrane proteins